MFIIFTHEFKTHFPNRKGNSPNRKRNYFSYFQASDQKTSFAKCFSVSYFQFCCYLQTSEEKTYFTKCLSFFPWIEIHFLNRKWNYLSHFRASDQKTSFTTSSPYKPKCSTLFFNTGNITFQTGNGIISPTYRPLIKKLLLQHLLHIYQGIQNCFSKQDMELSKRETELFLPLPGLLWKNFFYNIFSISTKEFKMDF